MNRAQKAESIETLKGVFADAGAVVVTHYMGLTVAEMTDLRLRLRKEGAQIKVVKNTLAQKALNGSVGEAGEQAARVATTAIRRLARRLDMARFRRRLSGLRKRRAGGSAHGLSFRPPSSIRAHFR